MLSRAITAGGVLAGAARAFHDATLKFFTPDSFTVGASGRPAERWSPITASTRTALAEICDITGPRISTAISISPPRSAVISAGVPLKATIWASMPVLDLNSSPARFWVLPTLIVPMLSLPGVALAKAISSARVLKRDSKPVISAMSKNPRVEMGAKSLTGSKGRDLNSPADTAVPLDINSSV